MISPEHRQVVWLPIAFIGLFLQLDNLIYAQLHIDALVQERRNPSALAMELRLSCTNRSIISPS